MFLDAVSGCPFRASGIKPKTQGKPWAKFFSPLRAGFFGPLDDKNDFESKCNRCGGGNRLTAPACTFQVELLVGAKRLEGLG